MQRDVGRSRRVEVHARVAAAAIAKTRHGGYADAAAYTAPVAGDIGTDDWAPTLHAAHTIAVGSAMAGEGPAADQGDGRPRPQTVLGVAGGGAVNELHGVGIRRDVETIRLGLDEDVGIGVGPAAMAVIVDAVAAVAAKEAVGQANIPRAGRAAGADTESVGY